MYPKTEFILHNRHITVELLIKEGLIMLAEAQNNYRFVRKTQLAPGEYRKNFHQIDREVMAVISSAEADQVTPLMSKIYLRLVNAPERFWERDGVLRIEAEVREEKVVKAWAVLCELVGVASATASKAVQWMHEQGIIGYFSGKNGVGLRIFLNRAVSSIGVRQIPAGKKILAFPPASSERAHGSANEPAFNDSYAVRETSDTDINSRAPKNGADTNQVGDKTSAPAIPPVGDSQVTEKKGGEVGPAETGAPAAIPVEEIVRRLRSELEPSLNRAAAQAAKLEHERTREWLERHGIPKATRVAQREAYNVLRSHGVINAKAERWPTLIWPQFQITLRSGLLRVMSEVGILRRRTKPARRASAPAWR
ncbi:MAG: hypothetical protein LC800_23315 [Acidobacteria bacterium]|nr:hypothetical protein [Acidobacteriota bacterium]